jgi:two-component system KDP operon response regulator KdpE
MELDPDRRVVRKTNRVVHLTPKAFELLHYLMAHAGVPLTHSRLLRALWGPEYGGEIEYLRTFVHQLRQRLEDDPSAPEYLLTETGLGYRFREP